MKLMMLLKMLMNWRSDADHDQVAYMSEVMSTVAENEDSILEGYVLVYQLAWSSIGSICISCSNNTEEAVTCKEVGGNRQVSIGKRMIGLHFICDMRKLRTTRQGLSQLE